MFLDRHRALLPWRQKAMFQRRSKVISTKLSQRRMRKQIYWNRKWNSFSSKRGMSNNNLIRKMMISHWSHWRMKKRELEWGTWWRVCVYSRGLSRATTREHLQNLTFISIIRNLMESQRNMQSEKRLCLRSCNRLLRRRRVRHWATMYTARNA